MFFQKPLIKWIPYFLLIQNNNLIPTIYGQSSPSPCDQPNQVVQINNQEDINKLAICRSFTGTISVNSTIPDLQLNTIEQVNGDLLIYNMSSLHSIELSSLRSVTGTLKIANNPLLSNIVLTRLTDVNTAIFNVLPSIKSLEFPSIIQHAHRIDVTDTNTTILNGINASTIDEVNIAGNKYLNDIRLNQIQSIQKSFYASNNGDKLNLTLLGLQKIQSGTFESLQDIQLYNLQAVNEGLYFNNNQFRSIDLSNVTQWPGALSMENNTNLEYVNVTKLQKLGGAIKIKNNNRLVFVNVFPELNEVGGSMELVGSFNDISLPKLHDVHGGFIAKSSSQNFSCEKINELKHNQVVKGHSFSCYHSSLKDGTLSSNSIKLTINVSISLLLIFFTSSLFI
ncbi:hypothetical protein BJ944DRAFT_184310 [Cunninghamella echinulata]|nr:hypothetical protein BJ944DRAFT_184310 [Cunninghamella echinulata]